MSLCRSCCNNYFTCLFSQIAGQGQGQDNHPAGMSFPGGPLALTRGSLGDSLDVTWEQDQAEDGGLIFHHGSTFHTPPSRHVVSKQHQREEAFDSFYRKIRGNHHGDLDFGHHGNLKVRGRVLQGSEAGVVQLYKGRQAGGSEGGGDSCDEFEA